MDLGYNNLIKLLTFCAIFLLYIICNVPHRSLMMEGDFRYDHTHNLRKVEFRLDRYNYKDIVRTSENLLVQVVRSEYFSMISISCRIPST